MKNNVFFIQYKVDTWIESDYVGIAEITYFPKSDQDGVYNWPETELDYKEASGT